MSDHPKEAERELKRIFICNDTCLDMFRWLSHEKVGLALALVCRRFDALVDTHFRSRQWALGTLEIYKSTNGVTRVFKLTGFSRKPFPIAQTPPPNGVIEFERIKFSFFSPAVIAFFRHIGRLLQSDIALVFFSFSENEFASMIWPLLNVSAIVKMRSVCRISSFRFRRLIFLRILRNCANLRFVHIELCDNPSSRIAHDVSVRKSADQALCEWLHIPRDDGQPKVLRYDFGTILMDELKTKFRNASTGVNFFIILPDHLTVPFELENSLTRERLELRPIENERYDNSWLVVRCPIYKDADQWAKWESEALEEDFDWKVLEFEY